jgi:ABC-2 type transport system permease protein
MTSIALPDAAARRLVHRSWRLLRVGFLNERAFRIRLVIAPVTLAVQLYLYDRLWTAVFQHTSKAAGLTLKQTLTYSLMALLMARVRWSARSFPQRDSVSMSVREGTIAYWYMRPISPGRFYMWRQAGDMAYGAAWALLGFLVILSAHVIDPPHATSGAVVFAASMLLGQVVLYYLGAIVDIAMFWMLSNNGLARMYYFVQDLLSGVFVPLPFMPAAMLTLATWLPFSSGINVPLSLYVGRIPMSHAGSQVLLQLFWCIVLAACTKLLWARASRRVTVQGG